MGDAKADPARGGPEFAESPPGRASVPPFDAGPDEALADGALDQAVEHEIERSFVPGFVTRIRGRPLTFVLLAGWFVGLLAIGGALGQPLSWRFWVLASCVVPGMGAAVLKLRRRWGLMAVNQRLVLFLLGLVTYAAVIVTTGGIVSPFLVMLLMLTTIGAIDLGRARPTILLVAATVAVLWGFVLAEWLGFGPLPPHWLREVTPAAGGWYPWIVGIVMTAMMATGAMRALAQRRAMERVIARATTAQRETVAAMRDRNRDLLTLSGILAHELRNPLTSIQGLAWLLADELPAGGRQAEHAAVLLQESRRMGSTLDEFLNLSRPLEGVSMRSVSLSSLASDVKVLHEGLAAARGVTLEVDAPRASERPCEPRKLRQALGNLIQNALDAVPRGGHVTLRVRSRSGGETLFEVEDDGSGLAAEVRDRLFRPGATTKPHGTGLGLTIARWIAEEHGGSLEIRDRPAGGCLATLVLPAMPDRAAEPGQDALQGAVA